jgi:hypothetical protein
MLSPPQGCPAASAPAPVALRDEPSAATRTGHRSDIARALIPGISIACCTLKRHKSPAAHMLDMPSSCHRRMVGRVHELLRAHLVALLYDQAISRTLRVHHSPRCHLALAAGLR